MRAASSTPPEQARDLRQQREQRESAARRTTAAGLAGQCGEELADDDARRAIEQTAADARDLAADYGVIAVGQVCPSLAVGRERDASLGSAEAERTGGAPTQGDRTWRIGIEKFDIGAITPADRADAERDIGAEMGVRDLVDALAAGNDGLQRGGIE